MIISRKLFSSNEDLNELLDKAFCEGYEYAQAEFSEKKKEEKKKVKLRDIDSHRGLGRSYFLGGAQGAIGGYLGKKKAEELDDQGASDEEIIKESGRYGGKTGAIGGAITGGLSAAQIAAIPGLSKRAKAGIAASALATSTGLGYLGGRLGAEKNARTRTEKRRLIERD